MQRFMIQSIFHYIIGIFNSERIISVSFSELDEILTKGAKKWYVHF